MRVRVFNTIGPLQVIIEDDTNSHRPEEAARLRIPDEILPELLFQGLHRAYHNNKMTDRLWDMCHVAVEQPRPTRKHDER